MKNGPMDPRVRTLQIMPSPSLPSVIAVSLNLFSIQIFMPVGSYIYKEMTCLIYSFRNPTCLTFCSVGLSVGHLGNSSIKYQLGLFKFSVGSEESCSLDFVKGHFLGDTNELTSKLEPEALALGTFVHVVVDPASQKSTKIPPLWRESLETILNEA